MKTDRTTKILLLFVGAGLWAIAAAISRPAANAQAKDSAMAEVRARKFVLVDLNGKTRAFMDTSKDEISGLHLTDEKGNTRALLGTDSDGTPRYHMFDDKGRLRLIVFTYKNGSSGLTLLDDTGNIRTLLEAGKDGKSELLLVDDKGKTIFEAP